MGELSETLVWLDICHGSEYVSDKEYESLFNLAEGCGQLVGYMMQNPSKFGIITNGK